VPETDSKPGCEREIIKHLSSEIKAHSEYLKTLRSQVAFTILVGPFVVLGSFLVATKGAPITAPFRKTQLALAVVGATAYLALGLYGSKLDGHVTEQCDRWRCAIFKLSKGEPLTKEDFVFEHHLVGGYMWGFALVLIAFVSIAAFFVLMLPAAT